MATTRFRTTLCDMLGIDFPVMLAAMAPVLSARAQLGLERMLDDLERRPALAAGSPPPRSQQIAREVGQVVKDITREVRKALEEK